MNTMQHEDQDLQEFLAGRDDLSQQLNGLPQPSPSPELDAAIFARISGELAKESQAAKKTKSGFAQLIDFIQTHLQSFWYLPVGATALLLIGLNLREPSQRTEVAVKSTPTVPQVSNKTERESVLAATSVTTRPEDKLAIVRHKRPTQTEPKLVLAQAVPLQIAPAPARVEITGSRIVQTTAQSSSTQSFVAATPSAKNLAEEKTNAIAELASTQAQKTEDLSQQRTRAAGVDTYLKKEVDAPVTIAVAAPEIAVEMPKAKAPETVSPPWISSPNLWLAHIEAQLDRGYKQDGLKEWDQFQKAYPHHTVAKQLREKIMREQAKKSP